MAKKKTEVELFDVGDIITTTTAEGNDIKPGDKARVIDIVMPVDTEDKVGFYCIETPSVYNGAVTFDTAKRVFTAEEAKTEMKAPTKTEFLAYLGSVLLGDEDGIDVNETEKNVDESAVYLRGNTANGTPFVAKVSIDYVEEENL